MRAHTKLCQVAFLAIRPEMQWELRSKKGGIGRSGKDAVFAMASLDLSELGSSIFLPPVSLPNYGFIHGTDATRNE